MSNNSKHYKNPSRNTNKSIEAYVPHYIKHGVKPIEWQDENVQQNTIVIKNDPKPQQPIKQNIKQNYATSEQAVVGKGKSPVPNIGNNMEISWSGVDAEIIDDLNLDPNQKMIDNNDYVDIDQFYNQKNVNNAPIQELEQKPEIKNIVDLDDDEYVLIINGNVLCTGDLDTVQEITRSLAFAEHEYCKYNSVSINDIIVLKKIKIKIGLFLE